MSTAILHITTKGLHIAERLKSLYPGAEVSKFRSQDVSELWQTHRELIFIMAAGVVVRTIAPLLRDKRSDPAVVVLDEKGMYAISLLSGHIGGANRLAKEIAAYLGGDAVITTASDVNALPSPDLWAIENGLIIEDWALVPHVTAKLLDKGTLAVYSEGVISLPDQFVAVDNPRVADIVVTNKKIPPLVEWGSTPRATTQAQGQLLVRPKNIILGIGCNAGTTPEEIARAVTKVLHDHNLSFLSVSSVATIDKKAEEPGLVEFAANSRLEIRPFTSIELNEVKGLERSEAAFRATGAFGVAEPSALLASGNDSLLVPKQKFGNVTVAAAELKAGKGGLWSGVSEGGRGRIAGAKPRTQAIPSARKGRIYIVGTGPGSIAHITPYALQAIEESDIIVGYGTYLDLIQDLIKNKQVISTGMTREVERGQKAVELAYAGKTVSVISGGDPGIYAMAGLVFELLKIHKSEAGSRKRRDERPSAGPGPTTRNSSPSVEVIPGISALNACAARLGAPLMHDFASVSLSDRLTPWELIEKRLDAAASADFVIVLYNPKSKGRSAHINRAREIMLKHRKPDTVVGIVKAAMREEETVIITDLGNMLDHDIDMQTTVIVGNSQTFVWDHWMVTPRGYGV